MATAVLPPEPAAWIGESYDAEYDSPAGPPPPPAVPPELLFCVLDFLRPADLAACLRVSRAWFGLAAAALYAHKTAHFRLGDPRVAGFVRALELSPRADTYRALPRRIRFGVGGEDVAEATILEFAAAVNRILHLCERLVRVEVVGSGDSSQRSWLYRPIGQAFVTKQRNFDITSVMMSTLSIGAISYEAVMAIATHYPGLTALEFNNVEFDLTFPYHALSRSIPKLRHLTLTQHNLSTDKLELLLKGCESLTSLHIMGNDLLDDAAARIVAGLGGSLRKLVVQCAGDWPSQEGLSAMFSGLHALEHVEVSAQSPYGEAEGLSDGVVVALVESCPDLRFVRLQNLPSLTELSVSALHSERLRNLRDIVIVDCWGIDAAATRRLMRNQKRNRIVVVEKGWMDRMGYRFREKLSNPPAYLLAMAVVSNFFLMRWILF
ncbi:hypothetical protein DFJ74DRAFT_684439 [Hyaloraphidium curvatum]|nr:hypothetical protein DFJ74DRAFT_684439 [Hyaloraphidium curvatum]